MILLKDVTKIYKLGMTEVVALDHVNLKIDKGEFVSIMGPSGSGKSTLLNMIGALDRPTSGSVFLDGKDISRLDDDQLTKIRREQIGFIFQGFYLIPTLNALENVLVPLIPTGKDLTSRAKDLLEAVGLKDRMHHYPSQLSGGEQQRVAIARALINDPRFVLADEPTGEIDTKTGEMILELMRKINRESGTTFVIVTHDPNIAKLTDRTIYLRDGRIIERNGF
ncbi:MAG: ABC transporter ATP-binding protein [Candidatus Hydrothermarchaeota archaeon]